MDSKLQDLIDKANDGDVDACANLGYFYLEGIKLEKNETLGVKYLAIAAEENVVEACFNLGDYYSNPAHFDLDKAIYYYKIGMKNDDMMCLNALGMLYYHNNKMYHAFNVFSLGMEKNDPTATYNYGMCLKKGIGCDKDEEEAKKYLKQNEDDLDEDYQI